MQPMAQQTNYLQIFLQVYPGVRILLDFRVGMNKPRRARIYTVLSKGGFCLDFQAFSEFDNAGCKTCYFSGIMRIA